ncbi:MAG: hypothetical protein M3Z24_04165 [Chloroflexota bacterium]|nr:hypothetical protein [Chloroflexota bacterium]
MAINASEEFSIAVYTYSLSTFPTTTRLETLEQRRRFELLRLAFFSLKLRKLEQRQATTDAHKQAEIATSPELKKEHEYRCNLLRHAIFQQIVELTKLDARQQAFQIVAACQK